MSVSIHQFDLRSIERLKKAQEQFLRDPSTLSDEFILTTRARIHGHFT